MENFCSKITTNKSLLHIKLHHIYISNNQIIIVKNSGHELRRVKKNFVTKKLPLGLCNLKVTYYGRQHQAPIFRVSIILVCSRPWMTDGSKTYKRSLNL